MRHTPARSTLQRSIVAGLILVLAACNSLPGRPAAQTVPEFVYREEALSEQQLLALTQPVEPLVLTPAMRAFSQRYLHSVPNPQQRLQALQQMLFSPAGLALHYDGHTTATASEAFVTGRANCLTFSHLFIALARDAGLDAHYQLVNVAPDWQRQRDWVLIMQHVNVAGRAGRGQHYVADVDRRQGSRGLDSRRMSDAEALAHHYNNLAMEALVAGELPQAYSYLVRALNSHDREAFIWTNLGTVLLHNSQIAAAREAFLHAIRLDASSVPPMRKFVATLGEGEYPELARHLEQRIERLEQRNPYHLAAEAQRSAESGNWARSWRMIERALALKPDDPDFYRLAVESLLALGHPQRARQLLDQADRIATRRGERGQDLQAMLEQFTTIGLTPE